MSENIIIEVREKVINNNNINHQLLDECKPEPTYLAKINAHERDSHITFRADTHIYTIDGVNNYISVTTWNHSHFEEFNGDSIIENMMKSKNWKNSKYYGMTKEEIKGIWNNSKESASKEGTKIHYDIECFYNNCPNENTSIEYKYFLKFAHDYKHLIPYRTEWVVWHEDVKISGTIDMVFVDENGDLVIYDWKRAKEISKTSGYNKFAKTECISHIPDTNYWHYCLQLNTYKKILEDKYGKKVSGMYLVCLHPNNSNESYQRIPVVDLSDEVSDLFAMRKKLLK